MEADGEGAGDDEGKCGEGKRGGKVTSEGEVWRIETGGEIHEIGKCRGRKAKERGE